MIADPDSFYVRNNMTSFNEIKKPHFLFIGTKWMNGNPDFGPSTLSTFTYGPLEASGFGTFDFFPVDDYYLRHKKPCDLALIKLCEKTNPDVFILVWWPGAPGYLNPTLETLYIIRKRMGIPIVAMWYDTWADWLVKTAETLLPLVDIAVVSDSITHFEKSTRPEKYLNFSPPIDMRVFYDSNISRDIDLSFNGGIKPYPDRVSGINTLRAHGIEVFKSGGQLEDRLPLEKYAGVFMRSKITLNWNHSGEKLTLKGRSFEATLCGAMLLESENPETPKWFKPMVEYVPFMSGKDLIDKARYYLKHDDERIKIALRGKQRAQELCNGKNYWGRILSEVKTKPLFDEEGSLRLLSPTLLEFMQKEKASVYLDTVLTNYPIAGKGNERIQIVQKTRPLVSIITICRNSERTIRRCIESVLSQHYTNIEYIIQDGASTDRTLDIIKEYKDDRIKLVSEQDSAGPSEAYFKGLCRCTGDIIGLCWADEEYFPHTVLWGVINLEKHPDVAAIYGDVYATDIDGNIPKGTPNPAPQWDLTKFLCWEIMPNYCSSFFRTSKLKDAGFFEHVHSYYNSKTDPKGCIMYDYYALVGIKYPILYIPDFVAKFSIHKNQQSSTPKVLFSMIPELVRSFDRISNAPETSDSIKALRRRAYAGFHLSPIHSLLSNANAFEDAKTMLKRALSYEPDINFLSKVVIDAYNYLNDKCLSNELFEFTDIIIKSALTFPNLHYVRAVALSDVGRYKEAIESIRKEHVLQPMHVGLPGLLFKLQLHMLLENQHVRGVLKKGILAKYQLREVANILNNLLTTTEKEGVYRFLQGMSSTALASLEDIVNTCLLIASREGTQELINRLKTLAATIVAVKDLEDKMLENKYGS